jgi:hypothetical protein
MMGGSSRREAMKQVAKQFEDLSLHLTLNLPAEAVDDLLRLGGGTREQIPLLAEGRRGR